MQAALIPVTSAPLYLNVDVPTLQRVPGVLSFFRDHRGQPIASSALMAPISAAFVAAIKGFRLHREWIANRRRAEQLLAKLEQLSTEAAALMLTEPA